MHLERFESYLSKIFVFLIYSSVILGSVGIFKDYAITVTLIILIIFLGNRLVLGKLLKIPRNYILLQVFIASLLIHTLFFDGKIIYFWMFFTGGLVWLAVFNNTETVRKYLNIFLVVFGFTMLALFLWYRLHGISFMSPDNLFLPLGPNVKHNHLGDLWSLIVISSIYQALFKNRRLFYITTLSGICIILFSFSRSSIFSVATGLIFIIFNLNGLKNRNTYITISGIILAIIFLYFSFYKSALFARPYFGEAIAALATHPLGVGMGNFYLISKETNVVHNLILEVVSGMGVFSIIFIYWIIKILSEIFKNSKNNLLFKALFLAMFVNFMFDSIYVIPGYFLLWFLILGAAQNNNQFDNA